MNIWLISLFDPTPLDEPIYPRFISIANAAAAKGHFVTHFTSTFRHTTKTHRFDKSVSKKIYDRYTVHFTRSMGYTRNISLRRFLAHRNYAKRLVSEFPGRPKPNIIFISMPPLSTVYEVTKWAENQDIPVVIDVIDPWPDSFIKDVPNQIKSTVRIFLRSFYCRLKMALKRSTAVTAISNGYLDWANKFHDDDKPVELFYLAIDLNAIQSELQRYEHEKDDGPLRLIYAGSLASSYDIPTIIEAAKIIERKYPGQSQFIITGKGPQLDIIISAQKQTKNLKYLGWLSKEELIHQYAIADVGLIQHKNSLTQTITYKFFNYMSAGLPLLNSLQSEMAELIKKEQLGLNNKEQDVDALVENIESYLKDPSLLHRHSANALAFTKKYGDMQVVYGRLIDFLEQQAKIESHVQ
ncbi:glycosyltransferase family 4 protein [Phaeodactylibacter xiamenensis]|uniref:glycosyltransferase family 4 protein n=1 Tax=Phaeodactylibacter xiamenensis TaxID=1524460 RepID=UPI003BAB32AD